MKVYIQLFIKQKQLSLLFFSSVLTFLLLMFSQIYRPEVFAVDTCTPHGYVCLHGQPCLAGCDEPQYTCNGGGHCCNPSCGGGGNPTPTPKPTSPPSDCTSGAANCSACSAPGNTCSNGNGSQTCDHDAPAPCNTVTFSRSCTVDNCNSGFTCSGGNCVRNGGGNPTPTPPPPPPPTATPTSSPTYTISGNVFLDYNHDGIKEGIDGNAVGITMTAGGYGGTTDSNGNYTILNVPDGTYSLTMSVPPGNIASTANPLPLTVNGGNVSNLNFGLTPLSQVSGTVYNDTNKSTYYTGANSPYNANNTVTFSGPTNTTITTNNSGAYSSGQVLLPGTYTVTYSIPTGYAVTYPGPPPSFLITLGKPGSGSSTSCNAGTYHDATCDANGNISGMDFGITNEFSWMQSVCGDFRIDTGVTDKVPQPPGSGTSCGGVSSSYALVTDPGNISCSTPGVAASGQFSSDFGAGQASTNNWVIGGGIDSESFTPRNPTVIRTSYVYMNTTATQAGIDLTSPSSDLSQFCSLNNCTLPANLPHGVYLAQGDVNLNAYTFPANSNYVILIHGNLTIFGNILVPTGSSAIFSVSGNITVDKTVGETNSTSLDANIQGLYSTDHSFICQSYAFFPNQCNSNGTPKDKRLNITGAVVVNAAGTGGTFRNDRDLCQKDLSCPTVAISLGNGNVSGNFPNAGNGLSYFLNAPKFIKHTNYFWQETVP